MKWTLLIGALCLGPTLTNAQQLLNLNDVLDMAVQTSIHAKLATTEREISTYVHQSYKSDLRPQISLNGNLPMYNKSYSPITQPDGSIQFIPISQNLSYAGLSLAQAIPVTGGLLSLNTNLNRFDDFQTDYKQYSATPVFIMFQQSLAGFNPYKWARKIEPLRLKEAQKAYFFELENIRMQTTTLYFDVLEAQNEIKVSTQNARDYQQSYDLEKKRIDLGTTTLDKLTHLELQVLQAEQNLKQAEYSLKMAKLALQVYIGNADLSSFTLATPALEKLYYPDVSTALTYARKNRPEYLAFERKLAEGSRDLAQAKAEKHNITLSATYGYNNSNARFKSSYQDLKTQQTLGVQFDFPIVDWGRRNAKVNTAKAMLKLQDYQNTLDEENIRQEVTTLVENLALLESNALQALKVQELAAKRYNLAQELYQSGKYSITDLTIAQTDKDQAKKGYISALRAFWMAHYSFRKQTGYDPAQNESLIRL